MNSLETNKNIESISKVVESLSKETETMTNQMENLEPENLVTEEKS